MDTEKQVFRSNLGIKKTNYDYLTDQIFNHEATPPLRG